MNIQNTARFEDMLQRAANRRSLIFSLLLVGALLAFEIFNFSTTDFAMTDLLGDLRFMGMRWATILALAFCGIDFAGIARLFTPEQGDDEPNEVWYLFGAWLLAASMNALLTWWGVSIALLQHNSLGNEIISGETLLKSVPIFVSLMVLFSRVLIIGTFSVAGERLFMQPHSTVSAIQRPASARPKFNKIPLAKSSKQPVGVRAGVRKSYRPAPKNSVRAIDSQYEQTPITASGANQDVTPYS